MWLMNVFTRVGGVNYGKAVPFHVHVLANSPMPRVCTYDSYVCTSCGYYENYIQPQDNRGDYVLEKVSTDPEWQKV